MGRREIRASLQLAPHAINTARWSLHDERLNLGLKTRGQVHPGARCVCQPTSRAPGTIAGGSRAPECGERIQRAGPRW